MKQVRWLFGLALLVAGCTTSTESLEQVSLQTGWYHIQVSGDEISTFMGETSAQRINSDLRLELQLSESDGAPVTVITLMMPVDLPADDYQICALFLYEADQCSVGNEVGVQVKQRINGELTPQREFGSGNVDIASLDPLTISFRFAPSFDDGSGVIITGRTNQIPVR